MRGVVAECSFRQSYPVGCMGVFLTTGLVVVGFSGGSIERIPANHLLVKNVSAIGVYLGGYLKNKPRVVDEVGMGVWMEGSV